MLVLAGTSHHPVDRPKWLGRPEGMDAWELHLVLSGEGIMNPAPDAARAVAGDVLLYPPAVPHTYGPEPTKGWDYAWAYFHPHPDWQDLLDAWPSWYGGVMRLHPPKKEFDQLWPVFEDLIKVSCSHRANRSRLGLNLIERLLLLLDAANQQRQPTDARVNRALQHMADNYSQQITIADLAHVANLSPSRFAYLFKDRVGQPPMRRLMQIRLERAAEDLLRSDDLVADIAARVGFNCQFYFSRTFSNWAGMSPSEFRKRGGPERPVNRWPKQ